MCKRKEKGSILKQYLTSRDFVVIVLIFILVLIVLHIWDNFFHTHHMKHFPSTSHSITIKSQGNISHSYIANISAK